MVKKLLLVVALALVATFVSDVTAAPDSRPVIVVEHNGLLFRVPVYEDVVFTQKKNDLDISHFKDIKNKLLEVTDLVIVKRNGYFRVATRAWGFIGLFNNFLSATRELAKSGDPSPREKKSFGEEMSRLVEVVLATKAENSTLNDQQTYELVESVMNGIEKVIQQSPVALYMDWNQLTINGQSMPQYFARVIYWMHQNGYEEPETDSIIENDDHLVEGLSQEDRLRLTCQPGIGAFQRDKLERDAKKNWDLFYKRNGDRFFKRRYWTRREFHELLHEGVNGSDDIPPADRQVRYLLEVGCGCGDFALPLLDNQADELAEEDGDGVDNQRQLPNDLFIYCCDISERAIELLKSNDIYKRFESSRIKAFVANITTSSVNELITELGDHKMDFMSLVFVLSALDPANMASAVQNLSACLKPGGLVFFRDYAVYDKAMLRFNEKSKMGDQFYVRQDGTRAYFFTKQELVKLFERANFKCNTIDYVRRETINNATKSSHSRIFLQAKFRRK